MLFSVKTAIFKVGSVTTNRNRNVAELYLRKRVHTGEHSAQRASHFPQEALRSNYVCGSFVPLAQSKQYYLAVIGHDGFRIDTNTGS